MDGPAWVIRSLIAPLIVVAVIGEKRPKCQSAHDQGRCRLLQSSFVDRWLHVSGRRCHAADGVKTERTLRQSPPANITRCCASTLVFQMVSSWEHFLSHPSMPRSFSPCQRSGMTGQVAVECSLSLTRLIDVSVGLITEFK